MFVQIFINPRIKQITMLSYFQQKILLELKEKKQLKRREQTAYQSGYFYTKMVKLEKIGMVKIKKDRQTNTNTYSLTFDGHLLAGWIREISKI